MTLEQLNEHRGFLVDLKRTEEMLDSIAGREDLAEEIADLRGQIETLGGMVKKHEPAILEFVNNIQDVHARAIFRLRFIRGLSWGEVAETIGGKNSERAVMAVCYRYLNSLSLEE